MIGGSNHAPGASQGTRGRRGEGTVDSDDEQEASCESVPVDPASTISSPYQSTALAHEGMVSTAPGSHPSRPDVLRAR